MNSGSLSQQLLITGIQLGQRIGAGAFGEVYEAIDPVQGRVAVKRITKAAGEADAEWAQRLFNLLQEGQRLKDAEHPHVVRVHQVMAATDGNAVFLVMEHCEGGSLLPYFEQGPMALDRLRGALEDAALGLQAIHARQMIHRDLKPANLLLTSEGRCKVADFGFVTNNIAKGYASAAGYYDHLAPEVHWYDQTSIKTDIWAFGMTAYRLLHGKRFYDTSPRPRTLIPNGGFAQKLDWLPHVPPAWRRFIRLTMHDDVDRRIPNAAVLFECLKKLPVSPDWQCEYEPDQTIWQRTVGKRRLEVIMVRHSDRRFEWEARSRPLANGNERRLAGSAGIVGRVEALKGLEQYFNP